MKFDFTDKASYLAFRAKWKADYKELSQQIRDTKRARPKFIRQYERSMTAAGPIRTLISKEPNPIYDPSADIQADRATAVFMLDQLKEAKALSGRMREAARESAKAA